MEACIKTCINDIDYAIAVAKNNVIHSVGNLLISQQLLNERDDWVFTTRNIKKDTDLLLIALFLKPNKFINVNVLNKPTDLVDKEFEYEITTQSVIDLQKILNSVASSLRYKHSDEPFKQFKRFLSKHSDFYGNGDNAKLAEFDFIDVLFSSFNVSTMQVSEPKLLENHTKYSDSNGSIWINPYIDITENVNFQNFKKKSSLSNLINRIFVITHNNGKTSTLHETLVYHGIYNYIVLYVKRAKPFFGHSIKFENTLLDENDQALEISSVIIHKQKSETKHSLYVKNANDWYYYDNIEMVKVDVNKAINDIETRGMYYFYSKSDNRDLNNTIAPLKYTTVLKNVYDNALYLK
jgi:hypothetical protein